MIAALNVSEAFDLVDAKFTDGGRPTSEDYDRLHRLLWCGAELADVGAVAA